jgi:hypothetical protein
VTEDDIVAAAAAVAERRQAMAVERYGTGLLDFAPRSGVRRHRGEGAERGMPAMASYSVAKFGEQTAGVLARAWAHKMQAVYLEDTGVLPASRQARWRSTSRPRSCRSYWRACRGTRHMLAAPGGIASV